MPGNSVEPGYELNVDPEFVGKTVHFIAEHEKRSLFDLKSIKSNTDEQLDMNTMVEISFPGAHSDVGGGYAYQEGRPERIIKRRGNNRIRIPAIPEKLNHLSRIPLREMHKYMKEAKVPLANLDTHSRPETVEISPATENFYHANQQGTSFNEIIKSKYVHDSRFIYDSMRAAVFDSNDERTIHYPKPNPNFWI